MTLGAGIRDLNPVYFALVMATGIVSLAAHGMGMGRVGLVLFGVNVIAYAILSILMVIRLVRFPRAFVEDVRDYDHGLGVLTIVAGTCVLGSQFHTIIEGQSVATALLVWGSVLWVVVTYAVIAELTIRDTDEPLAEGIHGGWLLLTVATESISVLGGLVAPSLAVGQRALLFVTLTTFLLGGLLYFIVITLVFYRLMFFAFDPESAQPLYWINAGAVAITTFAGTTLLSNTAQWTFLTEIAPFVKGFTLLFWVAATWWIPLLVILGIWRHTAGGIALPYTQRGYTPRYWGMIFPIGMYTVCTHELIQSMDFQFLAVIPQYFVYFSLVAWFVTVIGLGRTIVSTARRISQYGK